MGEHGRVLLLVDDHERLLLPLAIDHVLLLIYLASGDQWLPLHLLFINPGDVPVLWLAGRHGAIRAHILLCWVPLVGVVATAIHASLVDVVRGCRSDRGTASHARYTALSFGEHGLKVHPVIAWGALHSLRTLP